MASFTQLTEDRSPRWFSEVDLKELESYFPIVATFFGFQQLFEEQKNALREFFKGKDLYYSAPTGSGKGKSLIFQCIPVLIDALRDQAYGT